MKTKILIVTILLAMCSTVYGGSGPILIGPVANGEILATTFPNLSTAVHSPTVAGHTLLVTTPLTCNNLTSPSSVLVHVAQGGQINVNAGATATLNIHPSTGAYQIFYGVGTVTGLRWALPEWWGAKGDGVTNDYAAISTMLSTNPQKAIFTAPSYKINSGISWNIYTTSLEGYGTKLDFSSISGGAGITIISSATDANIMGLFDGIHSVSGIFAVGPGNGVSGSSMFITSPTSISSSPWIYGIQISGVSGAGWDSILTVSNGAFWIDMLNSTFVGGSVYGGINTLLNVPNTATTNSGEKISLTNVKATNFLGTVENIQAGSFDIFNQNVAFDYSPQFVNLTNASTVRFTSSRLENGNTNGDSNYWFSNTSANTGLISFDNSQIILATNKSNYAVGYNTSTNGGFFFDETSILGAVSYSPAYLINGGGRVQSNLTHYQYNGNIIPLSSFTNKFPQGGGFELPSALAPLTLIYPTGVSLATDFPHSGLQALKMVAPSNTPTGFSYVVPANPGNNFYLSLWFKTGTLGGNAFNIMAYWADKSGNVITAAANPFVFTTDNTAYTQTSLSNSQLVAPPGTGGLFIEVSVYTFGSPGTGTAWADDFYVDVM